MEHYLATGLRNVDGLLRAGEKRGELGRRRQQFNGRSAELLDMPLGVKIPLEPGSSIVFYRTKLGEKLHRPCGYFNLGDPYCRLLSNEYHSLHDPHLRAYYNRKDNLRRLKREGYLTRDGKVVCTLREFNEYRQYLTTLKIEMDKMYRREQKCSKEEVPNKVRTTLSCTALTEVQQLAESTVEKVLERVTELDQSVCVLRRAPLAISGRLFSSARRAEPSETSPPDLQQEVALVARELAATLLDHLGEPGACSTSDAPEPRLSARRRQQRVAGGATRAGKLGESRARQAEFPRYNRASPLPSLDQIAKDAVESVGATLQSFVASQFEHRFQCKFSDILKLPVETISKRQLQPPQAPFASQVTKEGGSSRASEHRTPEATRLLVLQPFQNAAAAASQESSTLARDSIPNAISKVQQLHSELKAYAETIVHDALETLKKKEKKQLEKEMPAKARSLEDRPEESTVERGLGQRLLDQHGWPLTAVASGVNCGRQEVKQPGQRDGNGSNPGQDFLRPEGKKIAAGKSEESQPRTKLPPIITPGVSTPSEEEVESEEELSPNLLPSIFQSSEQDARGTPEGVQKPLSHPSAPASRPCTPVLETLPKARPGSMQDAFPSTGQQYCRQPVPPVTPKPPSQRGARQRPMRVKLVPGKLEQCEW